MNRKFQIVIYCDVEVGDSLYQWALEQKSPRLALLKEIVSNIKDLRVEGSTNDVSFTKVIARWPEVDSCKD